MKRLMACGIGWINPFFNVHGLRIKIVCQFRIIACTGKSAGERPAGSYLKGHDFSGVYGEQLVSAGI